MCTPEGDAGDLNRASSSLRSSDSAADKHEIQLNRLSAEVSRIADALARISAAPVAEQRSPNRAAGQALPPLSAETVRSVIRSRRLRSKFFAEELFADPAWDMMLDLLQAEFGCFRVSISSLCVGAAVPTTTALRWISRMVEEGLLGRRPDPYDGRRIFVELTPETSQSLRQYFAALGHAPTTI